MLGGKKYRAFLVKFTCFVREVLRDRETFSLSGKREERGPAWRLSRPADNVWREGIVLRLNDQSFSRVDVPLTHRGRRKVVAARGSKQCPPRRIRRVHSGSGVDGHHAVFAWVAPGGTFRPAQAHLPVQGLEHQDE